MLYLIAAGVHRQWRRNNLDTTDWVWFVGLPFASYGILTAGAIEILLHMWGGLTTVAAGTILLLVIAIRNSWDVILWITQRTSDD